MLKNLTCKQEKLTVTLTVLGIEVGPKADTSKQTILHVTRNDVDRKTAIEVNKPMSYSVSFTGTFFVSKDSVKEKDLTLTLFLKSDPKVCGSAVVNVSEYVNQLEVAQNFSRRILFFGAMYTLKLQITIAPLGGASLSALSQNTTQPRCPSIRNSSPRTPLKIELRQTRSSSTLTTSTVSRDEGMVRGLLSPRFKNLELSESLSDPQTSPHNTPGPRTPRGISTHNSSSSMARVIRTNKTPGLEDYMNRQVSPVNEHVTTFLKDLDSFDNIMILDENWKTSKTPLLFQIVWTTIKSNKLLDNNFNILTKALLQLSHKCKDDFLPPKTLGYLCSTLCWVGSFLVQSLENERNEKAQSALETTKSGIVECFVVMFDRFSKTVQNETKKWLTQQENAEILVNVTEKLIVTTELCYFPRDIFEEILGEIEKILNTEIVNVIVDGEETTEETGLYCQLAIGQMQEKFYKRKFNADFVLIKELSSILMLQNKDVLGQPGANEICPHFSNELLYKILLNLQKKQKGDKIKAELLNKLQRERGYMTFYNNIFILTKKEKLGNVLTISQKESEVLLPLSEIELRFKERKYLEENVFN
ncbi:hypothetical protein EIN_228340 [Entamoeba invadens IP1]|uniref:C2 NT-type domain-containing protein n=1 Tax=Entamoeba invadens IP1 TaxID=370355 RepID=A0A0A1U2S3_ENTIV|nr:hypothetical protein EIN_228340 [Entamoeba invadens IP1]ELP88371.1 hypothetical protein EIN_228340 [Entamoeba invadens IP1]|eukprot:XP_004255142.1 hypothetical protein EIN_228340 [Entamoeba invadens IP1]